MDRALALAARGRATSHPNPRVGCVLVQGEDCVGEGWHARAGEPHAEVHALRAAGARARGAVAYVTLEPCAHHGRTPPCADALIAAGVRRVVAAMEDPDPRTAGRGLARLREAGIECETGLREEAARQLNRGFVSRIVRGRPWLTLKLAMSLDGRTAMASGESKWITGAAARDDVHRLRAEAGAVLTTAATVLADDPQLTVRLPGEWRQPDRIVFDTRGRVGSTAAVWRGDASRRIRLCGRQADGGPAGVETVVLDASPDDGHLPLDAALTALGRLGINEVLVECGPGFAGVLLGQGWVDELLIYAAPMLLGDAARPLARLPGRSRLADRVALRYTAVEMLGEDLKIVAVPEAVTGAH